MLKLPGKKESLPKLDKYRPTELNNVLVYYDQGKRRIKCFCGKAVSHSIVPHIKKEHPVVWKKWTTLFIQLNNLGYSLKQTMRLFGAVNGRLLFSWTVIEKTIREEVEKGSISYHPRSKKEINQWQPNDFNLEKTTLWDFPQRGKWAVHSGDYRGNWPPQIPRNLILKYTEENDLVVDAFTGGGTTLIEAWLTNRRSVGIDISKLAIQTVTAKINEMKNLAKEDKRINLKPGLEPVIIEGNALDLTSILDREKIDVRRLKLVCAHPPYLDSIRYTVANNLDLASIHDPDIFSERIKIFAHEVYSLICSDGICSVLIGDVRKNNVIVPLGLMTLNCFLKVGFKIENIIIKTQHRDKSSEFWVGHESNILLMAHEYLFVLRKS